MCPMPVYRDESALLADNFKMNSPDDTGTPLVEVIEEPEESRAIARREGWTVHIKTQRCVPCVWTQELRIRCTTAHQQQSPGLLKSRAPRLSCPSNSRDTGPGNKYSNKSPTSLHVHGNMGLARLDTD